jgi:hypothetical protein
MYANFLAFLNLARYVTSASKWWFSVVFERKVQVLPVPVNASAPDWYATTGICACACSGWIAMPPTEFVGPTIAAT